MIFKQTLFALLVAAAAIGFGRPLPALAQPTSSAPLPPYARVGGETIKGTITSIDGKYAISVRDDRGFIDNVTLHQGTIINPTGLRLAAGQSVTIAGAAAGPTFMANQIDTPYVALAVPYGYYDNGFYPYGPFGNVAFGFGFGGPRFGFRGRF